MRAAIYVRISEDDGEGLGVKRQEEDGRAEAEKRGWEVVEVYCDNDVSATRGKARPSYVRMIRAIESGHVQAIVVWDIDRLTRTPREIEDVIDLSERYGLAVGVVGGREDIGTSDGRLLLRIKASIARREVEQMSKRLKRKYEENATEGRPHGRAPYGMMRVDGRDVPDPETAPVLRELASRVLEGGSLRSIARDLTERRVMSPGDEQRVRALVKSGMSEDDARAEVDASPTPWNSTVIRQLLVRPAYAGLRQYQGRIVGSTNGQAVFDQDTHDRLVALLTDPSRRQNYRGREPRYLLGGIARCGRCGGAMRSQSGAVSKTKSGSKRQPPAYCCGSCFKVRRRRDPVDALVDGVVLQLLSDPAVTSRLFVNGDPEVVRSERERIAAIDAKLAITADEFADDSITGDQLKRISTRLRAERAAAEARLRAAAPNDQLEQFTHGDVREVWELATVLEKREVIDTLFDVVIDPQGSGKPFDPAAIRITLKD